MSEKNTISQKNSKMLISSNIFFKKINILEESNKNYNSKYYISLIVTDLNPQNSKIFQFDNNGVAKINQKMTLKNDEPKKKYIKIDFYEKDNIFSNLILKGEIFNENYLYDNASKDFICYLYNSEHEKKAILYYNVDFASTDMNESYNKNVKMIEKVYKRKLTNESNIHNLFLVNLQYIKLIYSDLHLVLIWEDKWKTLSYLFVLTFIVIFFKLFYLIFLPLYIIFVHIKNKNNIEKFIIMRNNADNQKNRNENNNILYGIMNIFNQIIKIYEKIIKRLINSDQIMREYYIRIGIEIALNFCLYFFNFYKFINLKAIILGYIWYYVLRMNSSFYSFSQFIFNLIEERTIFLTSNPNYSKYKNNLFNLLTIFIPFYSLYRLCTEEIIDDSEFIKPKKNINDNLIY